MDSMTERLEASLAYAKELKRTRNRKPFYGRGFIYIVRSKEFVKIGIARDVEQRVMLLQTGNPHKLLLLAKYSTDTMGRDEELLHEMFDQFRIRGEWFKIPDDILNVLIKFPDLHELLNHDD